VGTKVDQYTRKNAQRLNVIGVNTIETEWISYEWWNDLRTIHKRRKSKKAPPKIEFIALQKTVVTKSFISKL
jgi:hypothetical protein